MYPGKTIAKTRGFAAVRHRRRAAIDYCSCLAESQIKLGLPSSTRHLRKPIYNREGYCTVGGSGEKDIHCAPSSRHGLLSSTPCGTACGPARNHSSRGIEPYKSVRLESGGYHLLAPVRRTIVWMAVRVVSCAGGAYRSDSLESR